VLEDPVLISIDPGGTTGWSIMQVHPEALCRPSVPVLRNVLHWTHGELVGPEIVQTNEIIKMVQEWPGACLLVEDFILRMRNMDRELLSPVRIRAMLSYGLDMAGLSEYFSQSAGDAKETVNDDRLKRWGFYQRAGGLGHARDADRHSLTWLQSCKKYAWLRARCWPHIYGPMGEFAE
jgi:hypothetical protein